MAEARPQPLDGIKLDRVSTCGFRSVAAGPVYNKQLDCRPAATGGMPNAPRNSCCIEASEQHSVTATIVAENTVPVERPLKFCGRKAQEMRYNL